MPNEVQIAAEIKKITSKEWRAYLAEHPRLDSALNMAARNPMNIGLAQRALEMQREADREIALKKLTAKKRARKGRYTR